MIVYCVSFCIILCCSVSCYYVCRPDLIDWARVCLQTPRENLQLAFDIAERVYNVTRLLDPEGDMMMMMMMIVIIIMIMIIFVVIGIQYCA